MEVGNYAGLAGASSGMAVNGAWPAGLTGGFPGIWRFSHQLYSAGNCFVPASYQTLASQTGNFPVFEGTSLYSLRIDHNISNNNRLTLRANVSPSTVTGIEVSGQDQPFGQNAYSRTSQQTYRDVAGTVQDTWTIGNNKVNEFRFQYARRGLSYFYNTQIPAGGDPAVNITGLRLFRTRTLLVHPARGTALPVHRQFFLEVGRHNMKFGGDFNYLPLTATFTVNYGGVYDFGNLSASRPRLGFVNPAPGALPRFPSYRRYSRMARACPEISFKASAARPTPSKTFRSACSGRTRGA